MQMFLACLSAGAVGLDYSPCIYQQQRIDCSNTNALQVLDAFHRNANNTAVTSLHLQYVAGMTDAILDEILHIIASSALEHFQEVSVDSLEKIEKIPAIIEHFPNLRLLYFMYNQKMKILPTGSLNFKSSGLQTIDCSFCELELIEPGAFHGTRLGCFTSISRGSISMPKAIS